MSEQRPPRILVIAGSDSSGGAGIQADIKTISMLGGYAMTAITAVTAQNTQGVSAIEAMSAEMVQAQIDACISDIGVDAVKIGMLGSEAIVRSVASSIADINVPIVLDPVLVATSGASLADDATLAAMMDELCPLANVITPNLPELARMSGKAIETLDQADEAARDLSSAYGFAVLAKGGHAKGDKLTDLLVRPPDATVTLEAERIETRHTHGTGCTMASALATHLGAGETLVNAFEKAHRFVRAAILAAPGYGSGHGPLGHQAVRSDA